ncbi:hypothetical protein EDC01DRAFT_789904 [Geopyxis carbonaria]|nr:hypothetical protein EDC01DRAFT_789904 [Geopyxis carbonaria]
MPAIPSRIASHRTHPSHARAPHIRRRPPHLHLHLHLLHQASMQPAPPPPDADEARRARRRVSAESRKRIANACLACKARKQKCDGKTPCNICRRRQAECVYVEPPERVRKRAREGGEGERRGSRGESRGGGGDRDGGDGNGGDGMRGDGTGDGIGEWGNSLQSGDGEDAEEGEEEVEAEVDHRTRLLSDPKGRLLYIGETGSLSFLARVRKSVKDTLGSSPFTLDSAQHSLADRPPLPPASAGSPPPAPSPALIDLFFAHVNPTYFVLSRGELAGADGALLHALSAVGSFFAAPTSPHVGAQHFAIARAALEDVFESADTGSVRLLLLAALYMHYAAKRNASWTYVGLAVRVGVGLGLHRCRRRRMLWWTLYALDRFIGCSLGRPFAIADADANLPTEKTVCGGGGGGGEHGEEDSHAEHRAAAAVALHAIIGHVVDQVYAHRTISRDTAEALSSELKAWWTALPPCSTLASAAPPPAVVTLHLTYLHAVTLLTRPFLQRVIDGSLPPPPLLHPHLRTLPPRANAKTQNAALRRRLRPRRGTHRRPRGADGAGGKRADDDLLPLYRRPPRTPASAGGGGVDATPAVELLRAAAAVEPVTARRYHSILSSFSDALAGARVRGGNGAVARGGAAEALRRRETDLLDELQATGMAYAPPPPPAAPVSNPVSNPAAAPSASAAAAAHTLVAVSGYPTHPPPQQLDYAPGYWGSEYATEPMGAMGEFGNYFSGQGIYAPSGGEEFGMAGESPTVPGAEMAGGGGRWEFSWEPAESVFFPSAVGMGGFGGFGMGVDGGEM